MALQGSDKKDAWEWLQEMYGSLQPFGEFCNISKFNVPDSMSPVGQRVRENMKRFQSNYIFVILALTAIYIVRSPFLILATAASLGAYYFIRQKKEEPKNVMGNEVSVTLQNIAASILACLLLWIAGAGGAIFWLLGASIAVTLAHASLYAIPEEDQEQKPSGDAFVQAQYATGAE